MMTKEQIRSALRRFDADPSRVISIKLFCEVAGIAVETYKNIRADASEMSVPVQKRLEAAFEKLERGEIKIMRRPDQSRYVSYRKEPKPELRRGFSITMKGGKIAVRAAVENANNYTRATFLEEINGDS